MDSEWREKYCDHSILTVIKLQSDRIVDSVEVTIRKFEICGSSMKRRWYFFIFFAGESKVIKKNTE